VARSEILAPEKCPMGQVLSERASRPLIHEIARSAKRIHPADCKKQGKERAGYSGITGTNLKHIAAKSAAKSADLGRF
jgi:hypothetical protein